MTFSSTIRRCAALAAAFGIALQALWPLIAQARPADSISVPLCSAQGAGHSIQLDLGKGRTDKSGEHCKLCVLGPDKDVVVPFQLSFDFSPGAEHQVLEAKQQPTQASFLASAHPRAPPVAS